MGGVQNTRGNSGGVGGLFLWSKNGNSGVEGGSYVKFPPWWGNGYFLEPHNNKSTNCPLLLVDRTHKLCVCLLIDDET